MDNTITDQIEIDENQATYNRVKKTYQSSTGTHIEYHHPS